MINQYKSRIMEYMNKKGFVNIIIIIIGVVLLGGVGYFVYTKQNPTYQTPPIVDNSQCNVDPDTGGKCPAGCVNYGVPLGCVPQKYYDECQSGSRVCPL